MRFTLRTIAATTALSIIGIAGVTSPASAANGGQPDLVIRQLPDGTWKGQGVYNEAGVGQTRTVRAEYGARVKFKIHVENDGPVADTFRIIGTAGNSEFTAKYRANGADVTALVTEGSAKVDLAPGSAQDLTLIVSGASVSGLGSYLYTVQARSTAPGGSSDTVRARLQLMLG